MEEVQDPVNNAVNSNGKRKIIEEEEISNENSENENSSKILKLDEVDLTTPSDTKKIVESSKFCKLDKTNLQENSENSKPIGLDESIESSQNAPIESNWENVLRSERPLNFKMGLYSKFDTQGIVPENVYMAFSNEKRLRFREYRKQESEMKRKKITADGKIVSFFSLKIFLLYRRWCPFLP